MANTDPAAGIRSRYQGICASCGERFPEGTDITQGEDGAWSHTNCPEPTDDYDVRYGVCSECFTTIAANGACNCDD